MKKIYTKRQLQKMVNDVKATLRSKHREKVTFREDWYVCVEDGSTKVVIPYRLEQLYNRVGLMERVIDLG